MRASRRQYHWVGPQSCEFCGFPSLRLIGLLLAAWCPISRKAREALVYDHGNDSRSLLSSSPEALLLGRGRSYTVALQIAVLIPKISFSYYVRTSTVMMKTRAVLGLSTPHQILPLVSG